MRTSTIRGSQRLDSWKKSKFLLGKPAFLQGSASFFSRGQDSIHSRPCWPTGQIKDIMWVLTSQKRTFLACPSLLAWGGPARAVGMLPYFCPIATCWRHSQDKSDWPKRERPSRPGAQGQGRGDLQQSVALSVPVTPRCLSVISVGQRAEGDVTC